MANDQPAPLAAEPVIPVITYHGIEDQAGPLFTPPAVLDAQLAALTRSGYQAVTLSAVIDWLAGRGILPEKPVVLTFDDGYESVFKEARPRLAAAGFTATLFLITDRCGQDNRWPGQPDWVPVRRLMDWEQAAALGEDGWELGAHTRSHRPLPLLPAGQVAAELAGSQAAIQQRTGQPAAVFAQPYGATTPVVDREVRRLFAGAAGVRPGLVSRTSDRFHLPRIDAYYLKPALISRLGRPYFRTGLELLHLVRTLRRRGRPDWQPVDPLELEMNRHAG